MAGKEKTVNYVIKATKPVPFILALFQMAAKIIVGGIAVVFSFMIAMTLLVGMRTGDLSGGVPGPGADGKIKQVNTVPVGGNFSSKNKLLVVDLSGTILGAPPFPAADPYAYQAYGVTFGNQLEMQIMAASEDDSIKGIFIHTRTPGGTIYGSQAIYGAIKEYQEKTGKPVVAWVEGISASGGVYSTASATAIYAAPGSIIGSIGVLGPSIAYYDDPVALGAGGGASITTRGGIEVESLYAGEGKDYGNPYRRLTDKEKGITQDGLDESYAEFVAHVAEGRGINEDKIVNGMGAHVYGNEKAEEFGLIDATLSLGDAVGALALLAKLGKDDYVIVRRMPTQSNTLDQLIGNSRISSSLYESVVVLPDLDVRKCQLMQTSPLAFHGSVEDICQSN